MEIASIKIKLLSKITLASFGVFLLMALVTVIFTATSFGGHQYLKHCSNKICSLILSESYQIRSSIDPLKFKYDRLFSGKLGSINIKVSRKDIADYNQQIRQSLKAGFHGDEWKDWQTVDLQIGSENFKNVKMKLHGTSTTPIRLSSAFGLFIPRLSKKLGFDPHQKDFGLAELNASFRLKLNDDKFFNGVRNFTLISSGDDWGSTSIALTKMAKRLGAIVSVPRVVHGNFNGNDAGTYLISENIDKELLERNYGITNYGILKSNDVWDKALSIPHISMTDYTSHDKEQSGSELGSEYALGQFERLMKRVELNDIEGVTQLIELDDFARFSALEHFYGTNHSSAGDNLRYLYDFSSGKFRLILRIEADVKRRSSFDTHSRIKEGRSNLTSFDEALEPYNTNRVFQLLLTSKEFNKKRRYYLDYIVYDKDRLLGEVQESIFDLSKFSKRTSKDVLNKIHNSMAAQESLKFNISSIEQYLAYHKIYISHVLTSSTLEVLNESTFTVAVMGVKDCDGKFYKLEEKAQISPNYFNKSWLIPKKIKIPNEIECIGEIKMEGESGQIFDENIYINRRRDSPNLEIKFPEFNKLFDGNVERTKHDQWRIMPGEYNLTKTVILPIGISLKLEPGVSIQLGSDVGLLIRGDFIAIGGEEKITISAAEKSRPFASVAVLGSKPYPSKVILDNFYISGGGEGILDYVFFSGQMSIHFADVSVYRSQFSDSSSDDGLNIKYANITIDESKFIGNSGDQLDCDFCNGQLKKNYFEGSAKVKLIGDGTDGLDLSGSKLQVSDNIFLNLTDKAISIGEQSEVKLLKNSISYSNIGIAVKDGSIATLIENKFTNNQLDVTTYIKKKMYLMPKVLYADASESVL